MIYHHTASGSPLPFISKVLERDQFGPWSSTNGEPDMSNGNGISFVHDLVAMATAADKVPQLEARIAELEEIKAGYETGFVEKEKQLIDHLNAHDETKARLHNAEVARDDAERLFLEADDAKLAAVRAMRYVIGEAETFIKAVTPVEAKPSYEGKWLWDVQGWSNISLTQWLENGGSASRFVSVKLAEHTSPNIPGEPTWSIEDKPHSQVTAEQEAVSCLQSAAYLVTAERRPDGGMLWEDAAKPEAGPSKGGGEAIDPNPTVLGLDHTQAGLVVESEVGPTASTLGTEHGGSLSAQSSLVESKESASTTITEDPSAPNPTAMETNVPTVQDGDASVSGQSDVPFAVSHSGSGSQIVDTGGAGTQESASEKQPDDDLWAIPSRASHYSS